MRSPGQKVGAAVSNPQTLKPLNPQTLKPLPLVSFAAMGHNLAYEDIMSGF